MADPIDRVLARHPALPPTQDYAWLRAQGLSYVQDLAGDTWTDYNAHDPGVTILEAFCYALTDLGYRTDFSVPDLLASSGGGTVHSARDVLPTAAVTFDDLRRRLVDIPGVADASIVPHTATAYGLADGALHLGGDTIRLGGLIDVSLVLDGRVSDVPPERIGLGDRQRRAPVETGVGFGLPRAGGIAFRAVDDAVIESVAVYPLPTESDDEVTPLAEMTVELVEGETVVERRTVQFRNARGHKTCVPLGMRVGAGRSYRLIARGASVRLHKEARARETTRYGRAVQFDIGPDSVTPAYAFFYDWRVRSLRLDGPTLDRAAVLEAARARLDAERGLCQQAVSVCAVSPEEIGLCAEIELVPGADAAEVLAQIHHALDGHIAPPVRFYTVAELEARGHTADRIFEGPLLDHGFLDPDEWAARRQRCRLQTSDLVGLVLAVDGVEAVRGASVLSVVDGTPRASESWVLGLVPGRSPVYRSEVSSFAFRERGLPTMPDLARAADRLAALRRTDRPARLAADAGDRPVPQGEDLETADYWPLQNDLPSAYAVGQTRVPASASPERHAQASQLKTYLLFFEHLLADAFAQLATVGDLFSWTASAAPTVAVQLVSDVADVEALYRPGPADLPDALRAIAETSDQAVARRLRLLEHLAARLGTSLAEYQRVQTAQADPDAPARVAEDKRRYLEAAPRLDAERGQGADARDASSVTGFARRVCALLGLREPGRSLSSPRFRIDEAAATRGGQPVTEVRFVAEDELGTRLLDGRPVVVTAREHLSEVRGGMETGDLCVVTDLGDARDAASRLLDLALSLGADPDNYRTVGGRRRLIQVCAGDTVDVLATLVGSTRAVQAVFAQAAVQPGHEGFHVAEHILLRPRSSADPFLPAQTAPGCESIPDPYTFRASVVLPAWPGRFRDLAFRRFVEETLHREAPAHVALKICWVSHRQMREFEDARDIWRARLAETRTAGCATEPVSAACDHAGTTAEVEGARPLRDGVPRWGDGVTLPSATDADRQRADALAVFADRLFSLGTVYPPVRLHDCTGGGSPDARPATLGATQLGSL